MIDKHAFQPSSTPKSIVFMWIFGQPGQPENPPSRAVHTPKKNWARFMKLALASKHTKSYQKWHVFLRNI